MDMSGQCMSESINSKQTILQRSLPAVLLLRLCLLEQGPGKLLACPRR